MCRGGCAARSNLPDCHVLRGLIPRGPPSLADSVCVDGGTSPTGKSTDSGSFLPPSNAANQRSSTSPAGGCKFVAVLLPKAPPMLVAVSNASGMRVPIVAVPVTKPAAGSCRDRAGKQHKQRKHNKPAKKFPHSFPFSRNFTVAFNVCDLGRKSLWGAWGFQGDRHALF